MGMQTFLGPILAGTQKNTNTAVVTSNTPSASFLSSYGTGNSYRNTGAGDALQFINLPTATLTGYGTLSATPVVTIPTYSVTNGSATTNYPLVIPAGSYIDNIDFNVTSALTTAGTAITIAVQLIGAPGSTYATAQTLANVTLTSASLPPVGSYSLTNAASASQYSPIIANNSATPLAMFLNTGPTDALLQLSITGTGTTPAFSAGTIGFAFSYAVRNPDGSWYPVTPPNPLSPPLPATY